MSWTGSGHVGSPFWLPAAPRAGEGFLILAASMLILDANRRHQPVPLLARWGLRAGILATIGTNLAHGPGHDPIGALVSAWAAQALAGSFELLMTLIRPEARVLGLLIRRR
jgi:hypothetical protein